MITQCAVTAINSRSECNPFDKTGFLPIITSNMYSVVDKHNAHIFLDNKIKVCMPRGEYMDGSYQHCSDENYFDSYSLDNFIKNFVDTTNGFLRNQKDEIVKTSVCIDTAAGHLKKLHDAIRQAKEIHKDKLVIMAGNVASPEAFIELAKTGVDYIRVGIGGGGGCNTTSNTGVGQEDLEELIKQCRHVIRQFEENSFYNKDDKRWANLTNSVSAVTQERIKKNKQYSKVKIVADGISTYVKQCETKYGFNDNGYAAINKLLYAGADLVMIGKLFAQCLESAGEKQYSSGVTEIPISWKELSQRYEIPINDISSQMRFVKNVKYSGMSTREEQKKYKTPVKMSENANSLSLKPSEGSVQWIPVRWTLDEWLNGSDNQDQYPYLMGYVHSLRSAMSYTKSLTLNDFKQ